MNRRVYTQQELVQMETNAYRMFESCLRAGAFRLLGMNWTKSISCHKDPSNGSIIFEWE